MTGSWRMRLCAAIVLLFTSPQRVWADALDHWTAGEFNITNRVPFLGFSNWFAWAESTTWGNGIFVVGGRYTCTNCYGDLPTMVLTSPDGEHWTEQHFSDAEGIRAIAYGGGKFVGVSDIGVGSFLKASADGTNWTVPSVPQYNLAFHDVAYGNGRFVAVGGGYFRSAQDIVFSTNAVNWTSGTWSGLYDYAFDPKPDVVAIAYGDGKFAAIAYTNIYSYPSPDTSQLGVGGGVGSIFRFNQLYNYPPWLPLDAWYDQTPPFLPFKDVAFGNGVFVFAGSHLLVVTNIGSRIVTTEPFLPPTTNTISKIKFLAGTFLAFAGRDLLTSLDGYTWINRSQVLPTTISDITFGNGRFLAVAGTRFYLSDPYTSAVAERPIGKLRVSGAVGYTHQLQASDTLETNSWITLTNITLTNSSQVWIDPATNLPRRFYRTQLVP